MRITYPLPTLGYVLRSLVTAVGYRGYVTGKRKQRDKNLDDLANETRSNSVAELLQLLEDVASDKLAEDCGNEWAQFFRLAWFKYKESFQLFVLHADTSAFSERERLEAFYRYFFVPMMASFLKLSQSMFPGLDIGNWWNSPFRAWLALATTKFSAKNKNFRGDRFADHLSGDQQSLDRWMAGFPTKKLSPPYSGVIAAAAQKAGINQPEERDVHLLSGWLLVALAFQSLPQNERDTIKAEYALLAKKSWSIASGVEVINRQCQGYGTPFIRDVIPLLREVQELFSKTPEAIPKVREKLAELIRFIRQMPSERRESYLYLYYWFVGRLALLKDEHSKAISKYRLAVDGVWWRGGQNQHPILNEALLVAVGTGEKVFAKTLWDKTFVLGLNKGPKRKFDDQEIRRLSFAYEQMFAGRTAKQRIPHVAEVIHMPDRFLLNEEMLAAPNRQIKYANNRTRRTPLMSAIMMGTLEDVQKLVERGGNINDFIPESGNGPLMCAMNRAHDRRDPAIMNYLLDLQLTKETVNRPASTARETPLQLAIAMADANIVRRLAKLGADLESRCDQSVSALHYALCRFYDDFRPHEAGSAEAYFRGEGPLTSYDAKRGAALDVNLAQTRLPLLGLATQTNKGRQIFRAVQEHFQRPIDARRDVIRALMEQGADANKRYRNEPHRLERWTPTLFAAQIGDLEVFRLLVEHEGVRRGNPNMTLKAASMLERYDAMWISVAYHRHEIVSYLSGEASRFLYEGRQPAPGSSSSLDKKDS